MKLAGILLFAILLFTLMASPLLVSIAMLP